MSECIFCKIVNNEVKSFKIYEDEEVLAFLDTNPTSDGQLLVIPKKHFEDIFVTPNDVLNRISQVCKKMAILCRDKLGATGVNILNASGKDAQQSVFHLHFHVVPRFKNDGLDLWLHGKSKSLDKVKEIQQRLLS